MDIYLVLIFFQARKWTRTISLLPQTHQQEAEPGLYMPVLMVSSLGSVFMVSSLGSVLTGPACVLQPSSFKPFSEEVSGFNTVGT